MATEYTMFEGDINVVRAELQKASADGRKPILMNVGTYVTDDRVKRRETTYSILFEKTTK
jgi:hypothetical protein